MVTHGESGDGLDHVCRLGDGLASHADQAIAFVQAGGIRRGAADDVAHAHSQSVHVHGEAQPWAGDRGLGLRVVERHQGGPRDDRKGEGGALGGEHGAKA